MYNLGVVMEEVQSLKQLVGKVPHLVLRAGPVAEQVAMETG